MTQLKEAVDSALSQKAATKLAAMIKKQFNVPVETENVEDGAVRIVVNNGDVPHIASAEGDMNVATARNLSKLIDSTYKEFREKGWVFTQPVKGSFRIGVRATNEDLASEMSMAIDTSMVPSAEYAGSSASVMSVAGVPDAAIAVGEPDYSKKGHENVTVYANAITPVSYGTNDPVCAFDVVFSVGVSSEDGTSKTYQVVKRIGVDRAKIAAEAASGTPVSVVEAKKDEPTKSSVLSEAKRYRQLAGLE